MKNIAQNYMTSNIVIRGYRKALVLNDGYF